MFIEGLPIGKRPLQDGQCQKKLLFSGHIVNKAQRPTIFQLNIKSLTESKINVLHYLALQSEALVILLHEIHCTNAEKLILSGFQLAGSSLCMVLPHLSTNNEGIRFWTNLYRNRRLSGCTWMLMLIK